MDNIALPVAMVATLVLAGMTADLCELLNNSIGRNCLYRNTFEKRTGRSCGTLRAILPVLDAQGALVFLNIVL